MVQTSRIELINQLPWVRSGPSGRLSAGCYLVLAYDKNDNMECADGVVLNNTCRSGTF